MPSFGLASARAEASRRNGARSRGPKTPEGKARSAQNALKHGLCAQTYVVLPDEDSAAFKTLEAALMEELAPAGALQTALARRIVATVWRLERAERLEAELFAENQLQGGSLGLALIRDCKRGRAFDTLVRYRGGALAEFWRALRTLKALQAERAAHNSVAAPAPAPRAPQRNEPESRGNSGDSWDHSAAGADRRIAAAPPVALALPHEAAPRAMASLLAGTALARPAGTEPRPASWPEPGWSSLTTAAAKPLAAAPGSRFP